MGPVKKATVSEVRAASWNSLLRSAAGWDLPRNAGKKVGETRHEYANGERYRGLRKTRFAVYLTGGP